MPDKMKLFVLMRDYRDEATTGALIDPETGFKICCTLERPNLHNQKDNPKTAANESSCIPEGDYVCKKYSSARFPDTWEITGVPNRAAILFHCANYAFELLGCVAVATSIQDMNPKNDPKQDPTKKWYASQSKDAFNKFKKIMPAEFKLRVTSIDTYCNVTS
jgi:hypothetical protein